MIAERGTGDRQRQRKKKQLSKCDRDGDREIVTVSSPCWEIRKATKLATE